ncbi:hypothetical protein QBC34DRAFT_349518 [Podospora aff. communis PSN243]|uniref:Uncharacterized protein n=1 Tax=Podospora aff. communis PSN243 TaxID=3040156 RepID=A0AAV9GRP2_9PEZI|nr:hypothetical protein QBC34DRAFT_349518 [Podospora aff. communis PSN243]
MQSLLQKTTGIGPTPVHPENLKERIAVVVGGAYGIGFEISRALANAGCKVIMVNRKEEQGADAIETIRKESPDAEVDWKECDMGNLAQIRDVFSKLRESLLRLDFLVLSAGINANEYGLDEDGIDRHFGVNALGQFYVCNQLWPVLRKTAKDPRSPAPRVVFEASEMHRTAPKNAHFATLDEINNPELGPTELYGRTKLAQILFAKYCLVEKVIKKNDDNIYALSVHPGAVNTEMQQQWKNAYPGLTGQLLTWAMLATGRNVEQGSYSALWALTSPKIIEQNLNGWYFSDPDTPGKESSQASDPVLGDALWALTGRLIKSKLGDDALLDWNAA